MYVITLTFYIMLHTAKLFITQGRSLKAFDRESETKNIHSFSMWHYGCTSLEKQNKTFFFGKRKNGSNEYLVL